MGTVGTSPPYRERGTDSRSAAQVLLGEFLSDLKASSGRSYEALARRTGLSRSTLHRYCTGVVVPDAFGPLEAIGRTCGADRGQLESLYRLWRQARVEVVRAAEGGEPPGAQDGPQVTPSHASPPPPQAPSAPDDAPTTVEPAAPRPVSPAGASSRLPRGWLISVAIALTAVLSVVVAVVVLLDRRAPSEAGGGAPQEVRGPAWLQPPRQIPREYVGVTINSATGEMPTFPVGSVRLWDSGTHWALVEPQKGAFDWNVLDRQVAGARSAGLPVLYTFGATPRWAASGPRTPYDDGSVAAPPTDLADWEAFVRAVALRYKGKIQAYELWVFAPSTKYFTGTPASLVAMTQRAAAVLRREDPQATLVCPSMGDLWLPESRAFLEEFAQLGGYAPCDAAGVKLAPRDFSRPPEGLVELADLIARSFHRGGGSLPIWSTGTSYQIAQAARLSEVDARNYAVRLFLVGIYARYQRLYFYNWGGQTIPIVLQPAGGTPTRAAEYVAELHRWLDGARVYACGHGEAVDLPANVWRCQFTLTRDGRERDAAILWTDRGSAQVSLPAGTDRARLDGRRDVLSGVSTDVGEEPALYVLPAVDPS